MKIPELHVINYAGFMDLKDEPYYEAKSVLNMEDYPEADLIAEEIVHRCNCYTDLLEALEELQSKWISPEGRYWGSDTNDKVEDAIKKARGL